MYSYYRVNCVLCNMQKHNVYRLGYNIQKFILTIWCIFTANTVPMENCVLHSCCHIHSRGCFLLDILRRRSTGLGKTLHVRGGKLRKRCSSAPTVRCRPVTSTKSR